MYSSFVVPTWMDVTISWCSDYCLDIILLVVTFPYTYWLDKQGNRATSTVKAIATHFNPANGTDLKSVCVGGGGGGGGRHPAPSIIMSLNAVNTLSSHLASLTAECSQAAHVRGTTHCCYGTDDCAIAHQPEIWSECYECTTKSCIYPCSTMLNKDTIKPLYVLSPLKCIVSLPLDQK